ncbi:glutamate ligase domain-containing protein [Streptomyces sp. NPDC056390]|uniref:glutamate ligase domain-containing protein n=1 Tax=Streptomyces sp. NPDC056390 TaxID=3345806 RepID=UPI0035DE580F
MINDAFNANSESMRAGLETLTSVAGDRRTVAVLGEMKELGDTVKAAHADIGQLVGELGIDVLVTVGTTDEMTALAAAAPPRRCASNRPMTPTNCYRSRAACSRAETWSWSRRPIPSAWRSSRTSCTPRYRRRTTVE